MRQDDIKIGMMAVARVGSRLARVSVIRDRGGRGRRWECRTMDTNKVILCSSQRLRPLCGTRPTAKPAKPAVEWSGPEGEDIVIHDGPIGTVCKYVGPATIRVLSVANGAGVCEVVDRIHVAESFRHVARRVIASISRRIRWKSIPRGVRRGILYRAACRHSTNRKMFIGVMGHSPLPSPRMVAEAIGQAVGIAYPG